MEDYTERQTKEYVEKARKVHKDLYSYDKTVYTRAHDPVVIICKKHGEFTQKAYSHLNGRGCPLCRKNRPKKIEEYLAEANKIHQNKYDYSKVVYERGDIPVTIICPIHGEFRQSLSAHTVGQQGCKLCGIIKTAISQRITYDEFLERARFIHKDKYDYTPSKETYVKYDKPIKILCHTHGIFSQQPRSHCLGGECPKCHLEKKRFERWPELLDRFLSIHNDKYEYYPDTYIRSGIPMKIRCKIHNNIFYQSPDNHLKPQEGCSECLKQNRLKSPDKVFLKMKEIHNGKYTYPDLHYNGIESPIKICCPIHGIFYQTAHSHLKGSGCQKCGIEKRVSNLRITLEEFLPRARKVHGDKYDYLKIFQKNGHSWIEAKCPLHGIFTQLVNSHIVAGYGCGKCGFEETMLTTEEFINKSKEKFGDLFEYSKTKYTSSRNKVIITCKIHGDFEQIARDHIRSNRSFNPCPKCNASDGEEKISKFLERNNFIYVREFKLPGYSYRYDFCIPDYKLLIEFDGEQHFRFIPFFYKTESDFEKRVEIDRIKDELARVNGYYLIRVKYTVNNIDKYLGFRISLIYRYQKDGKLFKNFLEFSKRNNLPDSSRPIDYSCYKTKFN